MRNIAWMRIFGLFAGLFTLALALFVGVTIWVFYHPERTWRIVAPIVISKDIQTSWSSWQFKAQKTSLKHWHFDWTVTGFKVARTTPNIYLQFDIKLAGNVNFFDPRTGVQFETFEVVSTSPGILEIAATQTKSKANPHEQVETLRSQIYWLNRTIGADKIKISIPQISLTTGTNPTLKINLDVNKPGKADPLAVEVKGAAKGASFEGGLTASLRLDQAAAGIAFVKGDVSGKGKDWSVTSQYDLSLPEQQLVLNYKIKGAYGAGPNPPTGTADGQASIQSSQIVVKGKSDIDHLPGGYVSSVKGAEFSMELPLWPGVVLSHLASHASISAPVALSFISPEVRAQLEKNCVCKWPTVLKATLDGKVWASHIFDNVPEDRPVANLSFKFEPVNNSLLVLNLAGEMRVTHTKTQSFSFSPTVDANIKFPNFQAVKGWLESNRIMVPSPFDILQGSIEATVKTTLWQSDKGLVIPIDAKANLASSEQKVVLDSKIVLYIPETFKSMDIVLDFTVHEMIVELPPLDPVQGFPQLAKDSRLIMEPDGVAKSDAFKFRLMYGIRTSKPGSIRLLSKLAKPAIPVSLDLDRTAKGDTLGSIRIEPFELNYLHRTMNIDQLRVIMDDRETADFAVDGRLRMEQSQYKVAIVVSGSLRSPLIKLSSEPELSRSDIVSVLLYDRTSDQLVSADRETVGSFEAAISDRAIGLLGLWVFASTPIRSFSYNPLTKVYSATVKLAEGTTASIGTDWEEAAQLEVRKRVTRRWVLTASWAPSDSKEQLGKLVLQWEKRF